MWCGFKRSGDGRDGRRYGIDGVRCGQSPSLSESSRAHTVSVRTHPVRAQRRHTAQIRCRGHLTRARRQRVNAEKNTNEKRLAHIGIPQIAWCVYDSKAETRCSEKSYHGAPPYSTFAHYLHCHFLTLRNYRIPKRIPRSQSGTELRHVLIAFARHSASGHPA